MGRHAAEQTPLDQEIQEVGLRVQSLMHTMHGCPTPENEAAFECAQDRLSMLVDRRKRLAYRS